jgi:radical SAM superfamily enzyme YgiQ (UPF0313 family)
VDNVATKKLVTFVNTNQVKPAVAPIAFDYLYDPVVRAGFDLELLDLCFSENYQADIASYCLKRRTDFWGVTLRNTDDTYFSSQHSFIPQVKRMIQAIRLYSDAPIIVGGVGFSIMPEKILEFCGADFGIICEGEVSFPRLLTRLSNGQPFDDVSGVVYRANGGYKRNPVSFADLVEVGPHCRGLIDNEKYFASGGLAAVETKRGCSRVCIYCVEPMVKGRKVRLRDPRDIADEIEVLLSRGIYAIHINDSEFNLNVKHAISFCEEIQRRKLQNRLQWYAYGMPAPFPEDLARSMKEAGCVGMNFGTDSASEKMLRILKRTFRPKHIADAVKTCKQYGLQYILEILFGAPGETGETVAETIDFLKAIDAERVSITAGLRIFPGTELEQIVRAEGNSKDNPNLFGVIEDNEDLLQPLFYLSSKIAPKPLEYIAECVGGDTRFFGVNTNNFNYNANEVLVEAIARGERGAYWTILSKLADASQAKLLDNMSMNGLPILQNQNNFDAKIVRGKHTAIS